MNKLNYLSAIIGFVFTAPIQAADAFYCPQHAAYINVGMSTDQVRSACGDPDARQTGGDVVTRQVPCTQLIYSTLNQGPASYEQGLTPLYNMWNIPSGSQGVNLQVNIIDGRVSGITLNQQSTNGLSTCVGGTFQIGDDMSKVFTACGSPNIVNKTYINQPVPSELNPEIWVYHLLYQPDVSLTFVSGKLQSIN